MLLKKPILLVAVFVLFSIGVLLTIEWYSVIAQTPDNATYVSGTKCKTCHIKSFKAHAESAHASAFENVKLAGEETNTICLQCHSTGNGKPGGFLDVQTTPDLAGVTCQACHGPGSMHIEAPKEKKSETIAKTAPEMCIKCHKIHGDHPELGEKELPYLKNKLDKIQSKIKALEGK